MPCGIPYYCFGVPQGTALASLKARLWRPSRHGSGVLQGTALASFKARLCRPERLSSEPRWSGEAVPSHAASDGQLPLTAPLLLLLSPNEAGCLGSVAPTSSVAPLAQPSWVSRICRINPSGSQHSSPRYRSSPGCPNLRLQSLHRMPNLRFETTRLHRTRHKVQSTKRMSSDGQAQTNKQVLDWTALSAAVDKRFEKCPDET